jgi:hypothetical protein
MDSIDTYELIYDQETGKCIGIAGYVTGITLPVFIPLLTENVMYQEFLVWNESQSPPLDIETPDPVISASYTAKQADINDSLPSWAIIDEKFDSMLADANAATNLAQAKAVLIEVINVLKKSDQVLYWMAKNSQS